MEKQVFRSRYDGCEQCFRATIFKIQGGNIFICKGQKSKGLADCNASKITSKSFLWRNKRDMV